MAMDRVLSRPPFAPVIFLPPRLPLRARGIKGAQPLVICVPAVQADFILP
jgi:hypothetical protein